MTPTANFCQICGRRMKPLSCEAIQLMITIGACVTNWPRYCLRLPINSLSCSQLGLLCETVNKWGLFGWGGGGAGGDWPPNFVNSSGEPLTKSIRTGACQKPGWQKGQAFIQVACVILVAPVDAIGKNFRGHSVQSFADYHIRVFWQLAFIFW